MVGIESRLNGKHRQGHNWSEHVDLDIFDGINAAGNLQHAADDDVCHRDAAESKCHAFRHRDSRIN